MCVHLIVTLGANTERRGWRCGWQVPWGEKQPEVTWTLRTTEGRLPIHSQREAMLGESSNCCVVAEMTSYHAFLPPWLWAREEVPQMRNQESEF